MSSNEPPCVEVRPREDCAECSGLGLVCCMFPVKLGDACCGRVRYCRCVTITQHGEVTPTAKPQPKGE